MKKGFTLIELLVVVLIIGILSAVALPQYSKSVEKAKTTEALTIINSLSKAIDLYVLENGMDNEVEFLATSSLFPSVDLSIDITEGLDCSTGDGSCSSKDFKYRAWCVSTLCTITADRNDSKYRYQLMTEKGSAGDAWTRKACWILSEDGYEICKLLEPLGWIPS